MRGLCHVLAAAAILAVPAGAAAQTDSVTIDLTGEPEKAGTPFEGWGTALAWFANLTGGWPDAERERLADLFYGSDGLGWTIARYNIGGGARAGATPLTQPGANVDGFWKLPDGVSADRWNADDPAMWNWSADANQRWWLDAIKARVRQPIFEAFSNSPPWFMTVSGEVSGAEEAMDDNLKPGAEKAFASYLARAVEELQRRHGIKFRTLSPVNEPNTDYWYAGNRQEGAHWSPGRQAMMIDAAYAALKARKLDTVVSAPDETSSELFLQDWPAYPKGTRARIGQINVHSYGNLHQTAVRDIARANDIRLWMSEVDHPRPGDPEDFEGMASPLAFAEHIVLDLKRLEPAAWVFWQAVESFSARGTGAGSNWGLVKADLRAGPAADHHITLTRKYYAMAQFSRYIRPGYRLVPTQDIDTVAAASADGAQRIFVHVNAGPTTRRPMFAEGWTISTIVTDSNHDAQCIASPVAPPRSVTTFVLSRDAAEVPCSAD